MNISMMAKYRFNVKDFTKRTYEAYFGMKLGDKTSLVHPTRCANIVQKCCAFGAKVKSVRCGLGFLWYGVTPNITMMIVIFAWWIWIAGWNQRKKKDRHYPDITSARRPIPHCAEVPVFTTLPDLTADEMLLEAMDDTDSSDSSISSSSSMAAAAFSLSAKSKPFSQGQLNDLVRDFSLSK